MSSAKRKNSAKRKVPADSHPEAISQKVTRVSHPSYEQVSIGRILTMGQGDVGQLGLGEDVLERKRPAIVKELESVNIVQLGCGGMHTVALSEDGVLYTWGCNDEGALGRTTDGLDGEEFIARPVSLPSSSKIVQASAGDSHTAALMEDGTVYAWGTFRDANGVIGLTPSGKSDDPIPVYPLNDKDDDPAIKIVSGNDHVAILTQKGNIYTLGCGEQGQLGRIKECFSHRGGRRGLSLLLTPQQVRFKGKQKFADIFSGSYHTFAVTKDDNGVYAWGLNNWGQLGTGDTDNHFEPISSESLSEIRKGSGSIALSGGQHHSVVLDGAGKVYCVGRSEYGRLGLGENAEQISNPIKVDTLDSHVVEHVTCGEACSFAVTKEGALYSWGLGSCLQLGNGEEEDLIVPTRVRGKNLDPSKHAAFAIGSGGQHTALLARDLSNVKTEL